jgi:hypothetical protein
MISIIERCRGANASRAALTAVGALALAWVPAAAGAGRCRVRDENDELYGAHRGIR